MSSKKLNVPWKSISTKNLSLLILAAIMVFIYLVPPNSLFGNTGVSLCLHKNILSFECPGCGMTRAIHAFLHFDFKKAAHFNFAVFGLIPFLIVQTGYQLTDNLQLKIIRKGLFYLFIVLLLCIYLSRIMDKIF